MNGLAVLLCAAALGVDHNWRTMPEGELEYVLQIEPTFLNSLRQGEAVTSKLPATAKRVDRLCLRFATGDVRKAPQPTLELPPLASAAERAPQAEPDIPVALITDAKGDSVETTDVSHGWKAISRDHVEYFVQLSPDMVSKLRDGDEIFMNVYPEAGQIQQFTIIAGQEVLPREAARPPLAAKSPRSIAPAAAENSSIYGPGAAEPTETARTSPTRTRPPANEPLRLRTPQKFSLTDKTAEEPAAESPYGPALSRPGEPAPELIAGEPAGEEPEAPPVYGPLRGGAPRAELEAPVFDKSQFDQNQFENAPVNPPRPRRAGIVPPGGAHEYVPVEETRLTEKQPPEEAGAPEEANGFESDRLASADSGAGRRGTGLSSKSAKSTKSPSAASSDEEPKPWWTLFFTCCALFLSVGGNLYLGWTAAEFYSRYRLAIERMRSSGRDSERE